MTHTTSTIDNNNTYKVGTEIIVRWYMVVTQILRSRRDIRLQKDDNRVTRVVYRDCSGILTEGFSDGCPLFFVFVIQS